MTPRGHQKAAKGAQGHANRPQEMPISAKGLLLGDQRLPLALDSIAVSLFAIHEQGDTNAIYLAPLLPSAARSM